MEERDGALWVDEPEACFMCGELTRRVDVDYQAHFCGSEACERAIYEELAAVNANHCAHCGRQQQGMAGISTPGEPYIALCHPDDGSVLPWELDAGAQPDCYRLVTVYHEPIGARKGWDLP